VNVSAMYDVLRERMRDDTDPYQTSDAVLFQLLQQAYLRIQRHSPYWSFLRKTCELLFTTVADKTLYNLPYRDIDADTVYATLSGSSTSIPLYRGDYRFWAQERRHGVTSTGQPTWLIDAPGDSWIVHPTPSAVWSIYGDAWSHPDTFVDDYSEPVWDEDLHDVVWMTALTTAATRGLSKQFSEASTAEVLTTIPGMVQEMYRRYLTDFQGMRQVI